jgi:seryl-tRNA synthetase
VPGADQLLPRPAHDGARLHRGVAALPGQREDRDRHGPAPQVPGGAVHDHGRQPLPRAHGRGAGDEPPPGGDHPGRGLKRLHQFDKVELVRFCRPDESDREHQVLLGHAEACLQRLGLRYRVKELATGDTGNGAARCYDLEAWAPGGKEWLEVSSVSTFTDYQARRANIRYKDKASAETPKPKTQFVHTLNGSGLALPRVVIAILETYQRPDGKVTIPAPLRPYMGGLEVLG